MAAATEKPFRVVLESGAFVEGYDDLTQAEARAKVYNDEAGKLGIVARAKAIPSP